MKLTPTDWFPSRSVVSYTSTNGGSPLRSLNLGIAFKSGFQFFPSPKTGISACGELSKIKIFCRNAVAIERTLILVAILVNHERYSKCLSASPPRLSPDLIHRKWSRVLRGRSGTSQLVAYR